MTFLIEKGQESNRLRQEHVEHRTIVDKSDDGAINSFIFVLLLKCSQYRIKLKRYKKMKTGDLTLAARGILMSRTVISHS